MRATIGDVIRNPKWLPDWWIELPWRRHPLRKLKALLFTPGHGWLRWGYGTYTYVEVIDPYLGGPTMEAPCAPPLRRAAEPFIQAVKWVARGGGWIRFEDGWDRLTFIEFVPTWGDLAFLRDDEWPWGYLP